MSEPDSIKYIRIWLRANRPDQAASFEDILSKSFAYQRGLIKDPTATTLIFMATVGFEAGRMCEKENPSDHIQQRAVESGDQHDGISEPDLQRQRTSGRKRRADRLQHKYNSCSDLSADRSGASDV